MVAASLTLMCMLSNAWVSICSQHFGLAWTDSIGPTQISPALDLDYHQFMHHVHPNFGNRFSQQSTASDRHRRAFRLLATCAKAQRVFPVSKLEPHKRACSGVRERDRRHGQGTRPTYDESESN